MAAMTTREHAGRAGGRRQQRARLRREVLHLGELLGWQPRDSMLFTEALVQHPWRRCGATELTAVLAEQRSLLAAVVAKAARRLVREQERALRDWQTNAGIGEEGGYHADLD